MAAKQNIFWLKNKLFRPGAISAYRQALEAEKGSRDEILSINWKKRRAIVEYAYLQSPFYRKFYEERGFSPRDLQSPADWNSIPVLEKQHLKNFTGKILAEQVPIKRRIRTTTGGSTGAPLLTYRDRRFHEEILKWRMLRRWDVSPSANMLMLWRIPEREDRQLRKMMNHAIWFPTRRYKFDVSALDPKNLESIYKVILKHRPGIIWGYVGALEALALYLESCGNGLEYSPLVWSTAAPVSDPQMRLFKRIFGNRILDQYACSEIHWIASGVPGSRQLVVDSDHRHLEISCGETHSADESDFGDILLTDLENYVFPLIRYRNGDRGRFATRPDESMLQFDWIEPVRGRVSDMLRSPAGAVLSGEYLTTVFDDCVDLIQQFKFHQRADFSVQVFVKRSNEGERNAERMSRVMAKKKLELAEKMKNEVVFEISYVEHIEHDRGKTRFIQSEITQAR